MSQSASSGLRSWTRQRRQQEERQNDGREPYATFGDELHDQSLTLQRSVFAHYHHHRANKAQHDRQTYLKTGRHRGSGQREGRERRVAPPAPSTTNAPRSR